MKNMNFAVTGLVLSVSFCYNIQAQSLSKDTLKNSTPLNISNVSPDTNIRIFESPIVARTFQVIADYHRITKGVFPGFRVQIDFGPDRGEVIKTKSDFSLKYPNVPVYLAYVPPYFKICAGDFRTKLEALHFLNAIKSDYKAAFIVNDKINPPLL